MFIVAFQERPSHPSFDGFMLHCRGRPLATPLRILCLYGRGRPAPPFMGDHICPFLKAQQRIWNTNNNGLVKLADLGVGLRKIHF